MQEFKKGDQVKHRTYGDDIFTVEEPYNDPYGSEPSLNLRRNKDNAFYEGMYVSFLTLASPAIKVGDLARGTLEGRVISVGHTKIALSDGDGAASFFPVENVELIESAVQPQPGEIWRVQKSGARFAVLANGSFYSFNSELKYTSKDFYQNFSLREKVA
jgi:hypothetical protein